MQRARRLQRSFRRRLISKYEHRVLDAWISLLATTIFTTADATVVVRPIRNEAIAIDPREQFFRTAASADAKCNSRGNCGRFQPGVHANPPGRTSSMITHDEALDIHRRPNDAIHRSLICLHSCAVGCWPTH
jgi:hypothetical protein